MGKPEAPTMILEFTPAMRVLIEDAIEALILLLDEIDGDGDFEDGGELEKDPAECGIADEDGLLEQIRANDSTRYIE